MTNEPEPFDLKFISRVEPGRKGDGFGPGEPKPPDANPGAAGGGAVVSNEANCPAGPGNSKPEARNPKVIE